MNGIQTTIVGNLTADPELKFSNSGTAQLNFSVACERSWKNDKNEWENETSFVDAIAWRQLAEDIAGVAEKGMRVIATGRFEQRFWEDKETGQKRSKWQFVVDDLAISAKILETVTRKRKGDNQGGGRSAQPARAAARPAAPAVDDEAW